MLLIVQIKKFRKILQIINLIKWIASAKIKISKNWVTKEENHTREKYVLYTSFMTPNKHDHMIYGLSRVLSVLSRKIAFLRKRNFPIIWHLPIFSLYRVSREKSRKFLFLLVRLEDRRSIRTSSWLRFSSAIYLFRDTLFVLTRQNIAWEWGKTGHARAWVFHGAFSWIPVGLVYFLMRGKNSRLRNTCDKIREKISPLFAERYAAKKYRYLYVFVYIYDNISIY